MMKECSSVEAYAHTPNAEGRWQPLVEHLENVAALTSDFCQAIGAPNAGYWLGRWHDVGKFSGAFQAYLAACSENPGERQHGPDHKAAGTKLALKHLGLAALPVQGHHGGLHTQTELSTWLKEQAKKPGLEEALQRAHLAMSHLEPETQIAVPEWMRRDRLAAELFIRFLFSAIVDADSLDTEHHWRSEISTQRGSSLTLDDLWSRFSDNQTALIQSHRGSAMSQTVADVRKAIYEDCLRSADLPPGLFRLNVPTGGGKTRSAMAFALRHALNNNQQRVIVAVPFITITEQTADTYRQIFERPSDDAPVVLEHHSGGKQISQADDDFRQYDVWRRLAAENWDASIIVTTTVQLFESLFSNMRSRSRKNHRLAQSVIILDEAQALPIALLDPILNALRELCEHYGTTVVLSTATQPAFEAIPVLSSLPAQDIVANANQFYDRLRRVRYDWRVDTPLDWDEIADLLRSEPQTLSVLNTKRDALALLDALDDPSALHLSTLLCGAHRRRVIATVKQQLDAGEPCHLISTQVIEAGVDVDFPLVLRALAPLDSIIQTAGRCNREGRAEFGRVIVVQPSSGGLPRGSYATATGITQALLNAGALDPDDPETAWTYFRRLFESVLTDRENIQALRSELNYPLVAERFHMIEPSESVIVTTYGTDIEQRSIRQYVEELIRGTPRSRYILRALQPYMVSFPSRLADQHRQGGLITPVVPGIGEWHGRYDSVRGIIEETGETFIV